MKKVLAISLGAMMATACFAGCAGKDASTAGGEQKLQIYVLEQGYGRDWATNLKNAFMQQSWVQ